MDDAKKIIKNIVVTTDFSKASDFAILRAIEIAKATKAKLTILHVVEKELIDKFLKIIIPKVVLQTPVEYAKMLMLEKIHALSRHKINIDHAIIPKGKSAVKILQYARKKKVDLLVIGAHGEHYIRDAFVGTTAEYIAKKTQCPVLIVKNAPRKTYNKIFVPVDFSAVSKRALNYTVHTFPNSNIKLIHVGDYEYEAILKREEDDIGVRKNKLIKMRKMILLYLDSKMKKFIKGYGKSLSKNSYNITLGYPGPTITKEAAKLNRDLIIMGTQGHGRHYYLFIGGVANWVMSEVNADILLVPPKTSN